MLLAAGDGAEDPRVSRTPRPQYSEEGGAVSTQIYRS
jgi:hypothetical protein